MIRLVNEIIDGKSGKAIANGQTELTKMSGVIRDVQSVRISARREAVE